MMAKIALSVGAFAVAGLLLVLFVLTDQKGNSYGQVIGAHSLASQNLAAALLVFGLAMLAFASMVTWLIALYSSFRVAGPLFRLARNLQAEIEHGPSVPIAIRRGDLLQAEWKEFEASMTVLHEHCTGMKRTLAPLAEGLRAGTPPDAEALRQAVVHLKDSERRVKL